MKTKGIQNTSQVQAAREAAEERVATHVCRWRTRGLSGPGRRCEGQGSKAAQGVRGNSVRRARMTCCKGAAHLMAGPSAMACAQGPRRGTRRGRLCHGGGDCVCCSLREPNSIMMNLNIASC